MASIPLQFSDPALGSQLLCARRLESRPAPSLHSGIAALDDLFAAVGPGGLVEWGIPPGRNGRLIPLQFLKRDIPPSVWIYHHHGLAVFASSWISHGVDLQRLFFICSADPVAELRPLFLEDTFRRIIIDAPKKFSAGDLAFVARQARRQRQIVFLIRHYFLSQKHGNVHAALRINTWQERSGGFSLQVVKGAPGPGITLPESSLFDARAHHG